MRKIMDIIPAIDLKDGRCVRLYQGDYKKETVFSEDPVAVAKKWQSLGARRLHLVDLDGAAAGEPKNMVIIETIVKEVGLPVQLGGGIRDRATIEKFLNIGVQRVILGTIAIEQPDLVSELSSQFKEAIIIGIDARDGFIATRGWKKETGVAAVEFARKIIVQGALRILYTDIKRDGTLTEPNYSAITELHNAVNIPIIAAGGISAIAHLKKLKELGVEGAVIGKALYTGNIDLKEALSLQKEVKE
jgi:phosphoribosylformimino-5-aminoimidazole carboxamide ribotide isomerase